MSLKIQLMSWKKNYLIFCACLIVAVFLFYWIVAMDWFFPEATTSALASEKPLGEIQSNWVIEQTFTVEFEQLTQINLLMATYNRVNDSIIRLELYQDQQILAVRDVQAKTLKDNALYRWKFDRPITVVTLGSEYILRIKTEQINENQSVTVIYNSMSKAEPARTLTVNGVKQPGSLCFSIAGRIRNGWDLLFWVAAGTIGIFLIFLFLWYSWRIPRQKKSWLKNLVTIFRDYNFLMLQLVVRDFKTKYKRSILGVFWSFLNPLLTMSVQYLVFSTLFKSNIQNFPVYLLTGIVSFNFLLESVNLGLNAIVGNASLINKVYMPRIIFPVTRVMSSAINLMIALIPLLMVMVITGAPFSKAMLLLPIGLIYLICFAVGMSMILSTAMVFFRDTQFLWGVVSMIWMYLTPIIYPESIIPTVILPVYRLNPMYQFVTFIRTILLEGKAPMPFSFALCILATTACFLLGLRFFKKHEGKFVLFL